jgi:hypothetical protein
MTESRLQKLAYLHNSKEQRDMGKHRSRWKISFKTFENWNGLVAVNQ